MAISYVGGVAGGRAGSTGTTTQSINGTLTGGSNTSPSAGDLVVVWCSAAADTTAAATQTVSGNTSGTYSTETQQSQLGTTYDSYAQLNWMVQGSTPDTTITIPSSGSARNAQRWAIHVFRGVDQTTPWDVTSTTASGTASGRPNPPSITPSTSGAWILWLGHSSAATGTAYTAPTDFATNWRGGTTSDTADDMDGFGYYTGWTSGAYDPAAITAGGTANAADSWVAKTAVLKPGVNAYSLTAQGGSYSVAGQSAALLRSKNLVASGGSYTLTGQQAVITWTASANASTLTAQGGSYSLTGSSANLARNRNLTASGGSYALTGGSATLLRTKRLTANGGSYSVTGGTAAILRSKLLVASGGSYSIAGGSANITKSKLLIASGGVYNVTGANVVITYGAGLASYTLTALGGSYSLTGGSATISRNKKLTASGGSYIVTGGTASLLRSKYLVASGGSYALTGQTANLYRNRVLNAVGGTYTITGSSVIISWTNVGGYPDPQYVLLGVTYGPGNIYVGTMDAIDKSVKFNITTGQLIKPISNKVVITL